MTRDGLQRLAAIVRLRETSTLEARRLLAARDDQAKRATKAETEALVRRDAGEAAWHERLTSTHCDPTVVELAGKWLLQLEQTVAATKLEVMITVQAEEEARDRLAEEAAGETSARHTHALQRRAFARKRADRQLGELGDALLWRTTS